MGENDKPFACTSAGCQMTFTNEDHLTVHRKKHDMVLNLGLACRNNIAADQTPTPTRFIRNCEEVGLFQDLQNVNPFEETFRKAVEHSKSGIVHVHDSPNDDSLHTPQILHVSESTLNKSTHTSNKHFDESNTIEDHILQIDSQDSITKDECLSPIEDYSEIQENKFLYSTELSTSNEREYELSSSNSNDTIVGDLSIVKKNLNNFLLKSNNHKSKSDVKEKIKEVLHNKKKAETKPLDLKMKGGDLSAATIKKTRQRINLKSKLKSIGADPDDCKVSVQPNVEFYDSNLNEVEKRRAMNRMAQMRSRKRKKMWLDQMEQEIERLKMDNKLIIMENQKLKEENILLKSMFLKHSNCSLSSDLNAPNSKASTQTANEKKLVTVQPMPVLCTTFTLQPSQVNLNVNQVISNVKVINNLQLVQKPLPKLLPKSNS